MSNATERVERNDPVSALAIRLLVGAGACTQEQANAAFYAACNMLEEEAQRQNASLPWVVRKLTPLTEKQISDEALERYGSDLKRSIGFAAGVRHAERTHGIGA